MRGSQHNAAMALEGWDSTEPPRRDNNKTRGVIYKGQISEKKIDYFEIGVSLSDADDANVLHQRVADFIRARVEELTFETQESKRDQEGGNHIVVVLQRQWELRLSGVGNFGGA